MGSNNNLSNSSIYQKYIKNISKSELIIYQIIEIFRISLFDKKLIKNLIVKDKDKIEIEQPNLFNL